MTLPQCLSSSIRTLLSSTMRTATTTFATQNWSNFRLCPLHSFFLSCSSKPISKHPFSLHNFGSRSISHAMFSRAPDKLGYHEEQETSAIDKLRILKPKGESMAINCDSCAPGQYNLLTCPKCKCGQSMERSLSFHISENGDFAMWRCFHVDCGWAGQTFAGSSAMYDRVNNTSKVNYPRQMTVESLGLVPLGEKLIAYFAQRMISETTLQRNSVMQISGNENAIAFTYRRNGVLVSCKYRSRDKRFWQEKGTEKIFYGVDDIKEANEIIIVEGEIDKLSVEEAGFTNCVSVPDGAPQKVSLKELPSKEKDSSFQFVWNCEEYLDKASRIILASDGDAPGKALAEELARRLGRERCWRVSWPKKDEFGYFKDANEVLKNLGPSALRDLICDAEPYWVHNTETT